jgi:NRAMP (natural resistance-associated macrophage protein)-like metal ion transporter
MAESKNNDGELGDRLRGGTIVKRLGPGLITGAADDDPSGIATYSQVGAQFGFNMLWTMVLTYPLMAAVQSVSARIGRVTGAGLAANMTKVLPNWLVLSLVALLLAANTINIGADLAAMGAAARLVTGGNQHVFTIGFAVLSVILQVVVPYHRYVQILKWLTLALFAYVAVAFAVHVDWLEVARRTILPRFTWSAEALTAIVAIFGTTISPYLFFWQSSEEVEDEEADPDTDALITHPEQAKRELSRIRLDTYVGMAFSNLIAFFVILTTAATLHAAGQTDIQTSSQAAEALRPIAGDFAFVLFAIGIVGTGLLAIPVLAGSAAYAISELQGWRKGLERKPQEAVRFYLTIAIAVVLGLVVDYSSLDPIKALFWSAVLNGVIAGPIMIAMMIVATRKSLMGEFTATAGQRLFGWIASALMIAIAVAMLVLAVLG